MNSGISRQSSAGCGVEDFADFGDQPKARKRRGSAGLTMVHVMRLEHRLGVVENRTNGGVGLFRCFRSELSQYADDILGHNRSDVALVQGREVDAQRALTDGS